MDALTALLGMSLSLGGIGGFLSGLFARSLTRVLIWAAAFGLGEAVLLKLTSGAPFNPVFLAIALFWGLVAWFGYGHANAHGRSDDSSSL